MAWHGTAWQGRARLGQARFGEARHGLAKIAKQSIETIAKLKRGPQHGAFAAPRQTPATGKMSLSQSRGTREPGPTYATGG